MITRVSEVLSRKSDNVVTISPASSVYDAISAMVRHNVGAIVVTDQGAIVGIFTERDYLRRIILEGRTSRTTPVEEVMTRDVMHASPLATVEACMNVMTERRCRHLPVVADGELVGVISLGDCVKALLTDAEIRVQSLTKYITGQYPG